MTVTYKIITGATGTSTGNVDFTYGGWSETPAAAIILVSGATSQDSEATVLRATIGFTDGSTTVSTAAWADQNTQTTDTTRRLGTATLVGITSGNTTDFAATASFISGGVRLNFSDAPSSSWQVVILAFAGDLTAKTGYHDGAVNTGSSENVQHAGDSGVASEVVLFCGGGVNDSFNGEAQLKVGAWCNDSSTNRHLYWFSRDNMATATTYGEASTDICWDGIFRDIETTYGEFTCSQHADGFTLSNNSGASAGGGWLPYLSLNFSDSDADAPTIRLATYTTPTSTGNDSETGFGFQPGAVLMVGSQHTAVDGGLVTGTGAGLFCVGAFTADDEIMVQWRDDHGDIKGQGHSAVWTTAAKCTTSGGAASLEASFVSMDSGGFTLNWSAVETGAARYWWYLAFEDKSPPVTAQRQASNTIIRRAADQPNIRI